MADLSSQRRRSATPDDLSAPAVTTPFFTPTTPSFFSDSEPAAQELQPKSHSDSASLSALAPQQPPTTEAGRTTLLHRRNSNAPRPSSSSSIKRSDSPLRLELEPPRDAAQSLIVVQVDEAPSPPGKMEMRPQATVVPGHSAGSQSREIADLASDLGLSSLHAPSRPTPSLGQVISPPPSSSTGPIDVPISPTPRSPRPTSLPPLSSAASTFGLPLKSPCFLHTNLNQSASLSDYLSRGTERRPASPQPAPTTSSPLKARSTTKLVSHGHSLDARDRTKSQLRLEGYSEAEDGTLEPQSNEDDSEREEDSLTRQLAETATGVREMSRALGRTRVRSNIGSILIITKARDNRLIKLTRQLALYLMAKPRGGASSSEKRGLVVYVDAQLRTSKRFDATGIERDHPQYFVPLQRRRASSSTSLNTMSANSSESGASPSGQGQLRFWTSAMCSQSPHLFDFVITLGGDGTVLFTSWLFQRIVPPVLPFALGSLGFLTAFDFDKHAQVMDTVLEKGIRVNLRMRFTCTVYRAVAPDELKGPGTKAVKSASGEILMSEVGKAGWDALEGGGSDPSSPITGSQRKDREIKCFTTRPVESFEILNDLVVDRGPSPYVSLLELFADEHHLTTVQADGLVVATPTGSTAYSLSAGGSLVNPEVPAILISPICPHTLSFRPMLLPDSMELRICVPYNSRSTAWCSFDGRGRLELKQGDHIKVTCSQYPFPTVCADKQSTDWFQAIQRTLRWNERERQKSFVIVEESRGPKPLQPPKSGVQVNGSLATPQPAGSSSAARGRSDNLLPAEAEEEEEEEEEEDDGDDKFDIDDSSSTADASLPTSPRSGASSGDGLSSPNPKRPLNPALSFTIAHKSGVESPDRFGTSTRPHPPSVTARHIVDALSQTSASQSEMSPMQSSSEASARADVPPLEAQTQRAHEREARHHPRAGRAINDESSRRSSGRYASPSRTRAGEDDNLSRAFAFYGEDESDSGISESD